MNKRYSWRTAALLIMAVLMLPIIAACGNSGNDETPTPTPTSTATSTPTETQPSAKPIKIGVIQDWSGPGGMSGLLANAGADLFTWYVNEKQGGILVGNVRRPVELVKCDSQSAVAHAFACATKLITSDHVSVILQGGSSTAQMAAVADVTDPDTIPFITFEAAGFTQNYKWTANTVTNTTARSDAFFNLIVNDLKARSVYLLAEEMPDGRAIWSVLKPRLENAGVEILSEIWVNLGITDLTPALTTIKYKAPDILISYLDASGYAAEFKQIEGLGGWGNIQNVAATEHANNKSFAALPGAQGSYILVSYVLGSNDPGAVTFEQAWAQKTAEDSGFRKKYGATPNTTHAYFWNTFLVAAKAIEVAGSDNPADIAKALRSGNVEVDTPFGDMHIQPDGSAGLTQRLGHIENGEIVPLGD